MSRKTGPDQKTRGLVLDRDVHACQWCGRQVYDGGFSPCRKDVLYNRSGPKPSAGNTRPGLTLNRMRLDWRAEMDATSRRCSIENCGQKHYGRGWCKKHYNQLIKRLGEDAIVRRCGIPDCGLVHYGRGMCRKHWERNHKWGSPGHREYLIGASLKERIEHYSERRGDCMEWTGYTDQDGYGSMWVDGKTLIASRVSYEVHHGLIPDGLIVRHKCDNPPCVNPDHLEVGTHADNTQDAIERNRFAIGERNGDARLTNAEAMDIYQRAHAGEVQKRLAEEYGVGCSTVSRIVRGDSWASITGARRGA